MTQSPGMFLALVGLTAGAALAVATTAEANDFTGTRVGAHVDYMWGKVAPSGFTGAGDKALTGYDSKGGGGGVSITHDWQKDKTVFGLYASVSSISVKGGTSQALTVVVNTPPPPPPPSNNEKTLPTARAINGGTTEVEGTTIEHHGFDTDLSMLASAGGRIGMVVNENTLLYVNAGIASGKLKIVETGDNASVVRKVTKTGYAVGAGIDLQLNEKWTLGVNWTHYDLGKTGFAPAAYGPGKVSLKGDVATLGLSYKF